jgi:hypothetical protein
MKTRRLSIPSAVPLPNNNALALYMKLTRLGDEKRSEDTPLRNATAFKGRSCDLEHEMINTANIVFGRLWDSTMQHPRQTLPRQLFFITFQWDIFTQPGVNQALTAACTADSCWKREADDVSV